MWAIALLLVACTGTAVGARPVPVRGELQVLVVRAGFPDHPLARPPAEIAGAPGALFDRLAAWVGEVSAGRLRLRIHLAAAPVTLPLPRARYVQQPIRLAEDGLRAFAAVAREPADRVALAEAPAVVVVFAGTGRESHVEHSQPDDPWSNYVALRPPVEGFAHAIVLAESQQPPFSSFGVLCHELGHLLGLPELYAPGRPHEGIGVWGLMGQGTWLGRGDQPPHLEAWSKLRLGWVDVDTVERTTRGVRLPAVSREPRIVKIPALPGVPEEYYLLENRQRIDADAKLPGEGILVWHVDERVRGFRTAQRDASRKLLHLVEADGRGDLDRGHAAGGNRGDAGDPWAGPGLLPRGGGLALLAVGLVLVAGAVRGRWRAAGARPPAPPATRVVFALAGLLAVAAGSWLRQGPVCGADTAGMAPYGGEPVRVTLRNFSPSGPEMTVDVEIASGGHVAPGWQREAGGR